MVDPEKQKEHLKLVKLVLNDVSDFLKLMVEAHGMAATGTATTIAAGLLVASAPAHVRERLLRLFAHYAEVEAKDPEESSEEAQEIANVFVAELDRQMNQTKKS